MVLTALPVLFIFCLCLVIFHRSFLQGKRWPLSDLQWAAVDYLWYGVGLIMLLIGGFQVLSALERSELNRQKQAIQQKYFQLESLASGPADLENGIAAENHQLRQDIVTAIRETQFTTDWPLSAVRFQGRTFDSMNHFIKVRANELDASDLSVVIVGLSTSILDHVGEARAMEQRLGQTVSPLWLTVVMPYVLAVVIALRITKVTFHVRKEAGMG